MKQPSLQTIYSPKRNKNINRLDVLKTTYTQKWSKTAMLEGRIKFAHYYEYFSGSIILGLGDGFLRIAILWQGMQIAYSVNKLLLWMRKKEKSDLPQANEEKNRTDHS